MSCPIDACSDILRFSFIWFSFMPNGSDHLSTRLMRRAGGDKDHLTDLKLTFIIILSSYFPKLWRRKSGQSKANWYSCYACSKEDGDVDVDDDDGLNVKVCVGGASWRPSFRLFRVSPSHSFNITIIIIIDNQFRAPNGSEEIDKENIFECVFSCNHLGNDKLLI